MSRPDRARGRAASAFDGAVPALVGAVAVALLVAGCASGPRGGTGRASGGRDGPGARPPAGLERLPDAEPRVEAIRGSGGTSKPYTVLGRDYVPITDDRPLRERGLASWYGAKFHGQSTASGEPYDMYAMTAAHKTMPLPSYVRVRNPANGREAIVRVNDRGPFHDDRVIDLSYAAASRLDLLRGVAPVEIERLTNEDIRTGAWRGGERVAAMTQERVAGQLVPTPMPTPTPVPMSVSVPISVPVTAVSATSVEVRDLPAIAVSSLPALPALPENPAVASSRPLLDRVAASESSSSSPDVAGFWVQLGAFRESAGAEDLRGRAERGLPNLSQRLRVFGESGVHRVQAGPFATRGNALEAMVQVREGLRIAPLIVERR